MEPHAELVIGPIFSNAARAVPQRVAAVLDGRTITFGELDRSANRMARALGSSEVGAGDRVVVWADATVEVVVLFAALAKLGAVFVPGNPAISPRELDTLLAVARPAVLVTDRPRADEARRAASAVDCRAVVLADVVERSSGEPPFEPGLPGPRETDPHVIFFTSGSTGRPKGAVLSHRVNVLRSHPGALLEPRGPAICPYPLFHMGAWTIALQQWQARDAVVVVASEPGAIGRAVSDWRATRMNCIPAVWRRILDHLASPAGADLDLSSLRHCDTGTSATPLGLLDAIHAAVPSAHLRVFYGSTEAGSVACLEQVDFAEKPGSCGLPAIHTEVRIADDGELWVRGPLVFDGYFEDPEATAAAMVDGWYATGDLATSDLDGFLSIVGRSTAVIRTGGESVAPTEVEAVLVEHPDLAEVAVVGIPDERWGEIVCAAVVVAGGASPPGVEELRRHCAGRLAAYKHPRIVVTLGAIPRTAATAQVQRPVLAEQVAALLAGGTGPTAPTAGPGSGG